MANVRVGVDTIRVHKAGESHAEWNLTFLGQATAGGWGNYSYFWDWDDVTDNWTYIIGQKWLFALSPGEKIRLILVGVELDDIDPNDPLPGVAVNIDPITAGPNFQITAGDPGGNFHYTVNYTFNVI